MAEIFAMALLAQCLVPGNDLLVAGEAARSHLQGEAEALRVGAAGECRCGTEIGSDAAEPVLDEVGQIFEGCARSQTVFLMWSSAIVPDLIASTMVVQCSLFPVRMLASTRSRSESLPPKL